MSRSISIRIGPLLGALTLVFPVAAFGQEAGCVVLPDTAPIQMLGGFSDMRFTEEHAYGSFTLPRITRDDGYLSDTKTYGEWRERAEGILRLRGPKW